jgi:hypothetical protein
MTRYARPGRSRHTRCSSTSAQRRERARSQESSGIDDGAKLRQVETWLRERMKSVGVLNFGMARRVMSLLAENRTSTRCGMQQEAWLLRKTQSSTQYQGGI